MSEVKNNTICYGDIIELVANKLKYGELEVKPKLAIYDKNPRYVIVGEREGDRIPGYVNSTQFILEPMKSSDYGKPVLLQKGKFRLRNTLYQQEITDDKTSKTGFDGSDGYFGLNEHTNDGQPAEGAYFSLLSKVGGNNTTFKDGQSGLLLLCTGGKWKATNQKLTVYPKNEGMYLVWDERNYEEPVFTIKRISSHI